MKKFLRNGLMLAAAGTLLFTACDPEEETPVATAPEVNLSVETEQDAYLAGDVINLVVDFTADAPAVGATINVETSENTFTLDVIDGISGNNVIDLNAFGVAGVSEGSFNINGLVLPEQAAGMTLSFSVDIEDEDGRVGQGTLDIAVEASNPLKSYTDILVYAPAGDGSTNTWFSTNLGETVTEAEVNAAAAPNSSDVDFGYYYGVNDEASIASPNAYNLDGIDIQDWTTKNASEFKLTTISNEEYLGLSTSADLEAVWNREDNINEGETITNLEVGDVVAFQLDPNNKDGLYGVFKVITVEPGIQTNDYIEIEVLIQD